MISGLCQKLKLPWNLLKKLGEVYKNNFLTAMQDLKRRIKAGTAKTGVTQFWREFNKKCFLRNIFTLAHKTLCCWHIHLCNKHNYHQSYILACSSILWRPMLTTIMNVTFSNWMCYAYSALHFGIFDFVRVILISCNTFRGHSLITLNWITNSWKSNYSIFCIVLLDFSLTVKAATLIFITGSGSAISSAKQGKSGSIYYLVKN